jgi:hypothetical protein
LEIIFFSLFTLRVNKEKRILIMKKYLFIFIVLAALLSSAIPALAQEENPLKLSLSRDFGYAGFGIDIQGAFSMRVSGPQDLARVVYMIDGQTIGEVSASPFRLRFDTGSYSLGKHTLSAIGYTSAGQELPSNTITREFVAPTQGMSGALTIILPVFGLIILAGLLSWGIPTLLNRGKKQSLVAGAPRNYGAFGGTICPKCHRPFGMHVYGLNAVVGKFDRCPYCGKWSLVRRVSPDMLQAAEQAELEAQGEAHSLPEMSEEEKLRRDLENSRYQDL